MTKKLGKTALNTALNFLSVQRSNLRIIFFYFLDDA